LAFRAHGGWLARDGRNSRRGFRGTARERAQIPAQFGTGPYSERGGSHPGWHGAIRPRATPAARVCQWARCFIFRDFVRRRQSDGLVALCAAGRECRGRAAAFLRGRGMGADGRNAVTARLARWVPIWLALIGFGGALAHVTTTGLLRVEFTGGRMLYALSVALPELPASAATILTAAANGDRAAAETAAEAARRSVMVDLDGVRCRTGRIRIGGAGAN